MSSIGRQGNWLISAVGSAGDPRPPESGRFIGALYASGALVTLVLAPLPGLGNDGRLAMLISGFVAAGFGAILIRTNPSLGSGALVGLATLGTSWIGADVYLLPAGSAVALLCLFGPTAFAVLPAPVALAEDFYAAAVPGAFVGATGRFAHPDAALPARAWIVTAAVVVVLGGVVYALRERLRARVGVLGEVSNELSIGLAVVGPDGTYQAANTALAGMLGRSRQDLVGRHLDELVFPDDVEKAGAAFGALLSGNTTSAVFETRYRRPDGETVHAIVTAAAVVPERGGPRIVLALAQDVSEQRRLDEQRAELAQLLLRAQENERRRIADEVHDDPLQT
ncbi:MAG: PAS domain-containing protein, partial [Acidimicrobiales bacterium]